MRASIAYYAIASIVPLLASLARCVSLVMEDRARRNGFVSEPRLANRFRDASNRVSPFGDRNPESGVGRLDRRVRSDTGTLLCDDERRRAKHRADEPNVPCALVSAFSSVLSSFCRPLASHLRTSSFRSRIRRWSATSLRLPPSVSRSSRYTTSATRQNLAYDTSPRERCFPRRAGSPSTTTFYYAGTAGRYAAYGCLGALLLSERRSIGGTGAARCRRQRDAGLVAPVDCHVGSCIGRQ